jgi:hypothetical protein
MLVLVVIARENFDSGHFELFNFPVRWLLRPAFLTGIKPRDVIMQKVYRTDGKVFRGVHAGCAAWCNYIDQTMWWKGSHETKIYSLRMVNNFVHPYACDSIGHVPVCISQAPTINFLQYKERHHHLSIWRKIHWWWYKIIFSDTLLLFHQKLTAMSGPSYHYQTHL